MSLYNAMGIMLRWKLYNYVLEIGIFRNSSQNILGVLKGDSWEFGCPKDTQTPCWQRPCPGVHVYIS